MRSIPFGLAAATLFCGIAAAQPAPMPGQAQPAAPGMPPATSSGMQSTAPANPSGTTGTAGTSPSGANGAVNTSSANAATPARGANSFTQAQARRKIGANGYASVSTLRKDRDGVWRGTAQKSGQTVNVWLDYRGNVGQQ